MTFMSKELEINQLVERYLDNEKGTSDSSFLLAEIFALIGEIQDESKESVEKLKTSLNQSGSLIGWLSPVGIFS